MTKDKWLFAIDLDGTLLYDSKSIKITEKNRQAIQKLRDEGHIVCIVTGRPWISTKRAYDFLGLDTIVANYNGARIHNPKDYNFNQIISYLNLNDVLYVLGDQKLKDSTSNLAIEGPGWVMIDKRDENIEKTFGFDEAAKFTVGINYHKLPLRPIGVILDTKPNVDILKLKDYLQRKYGDLVEFSSWSKGKNQTPVIDMTCVGVNKAKALSLMSRYYGIPIERTVSIGDGFNDLPLFEVTEISVSMKNAHDHIKKQTTYSTKSCQEDGVAHFINLFLKDKDDFVKKLCSKRQKLHQLTDQTT